MEYSKLASSILVAVLSYLALRFGSDYLHLSLLQGGPVTVWTILLAPLPALTSLLPGFLAGLLCNRAVLAGFVAGLLGSAIYSVLIGSASSYFQGAQPALLGALFIAQCLTVGLVSAAAGGAAQAVRSNISSKPMSPRGAE